MQMREEYTRIRSILETPILDERRWSKLTSLEADAVFVDLEDSVPPERKAEARTRAAAVLADREGVDGKVVIARPNHLSTPWGADDIAMFAEAGVSTLAYPKLTSADELSALLADWPGPVRPNVFAIVETAAAVLAVNEIAAVEGVTALIFGPGDLGRDADIPLYGPDGASNLAFLPARMTVVLAGRAHGLLVAEGVPAPDIRDSDDVRARLQASRALGFQAVATYYAPHVPLINDVFAPSAAEREDAGVVIAAYEAARRDGLAATTLGGRPILIHDYHLALDVMERSRTRSED